MPVRRGKKTVFLIAEVFREFTRDDCVPMAGSLAFFTLFSFPPILAIVVELASVWVDPGVARQEILTTTAELVGWGTAEQVRTMLEAADAPITGSVPGQVGSVLLLLFAATMVLAQAQQALNRVWGVVHARGGLKHFLLRRVIALVIILGFVLLLLGSLAASTVVSFVGARMEPILPEGWTSPLLSLAGSGISFATVALVLAALFKLLPEVRVRGSDVVPGALLTSVLLAVGKEVIAWVLASFPLGTAFGAASSLAILLFWVFYSAAIVLWGAEFTKVVARRRGHRVNPTRGARRRRQPREIRRVEA